MALLLAIYQKQQKPPPDLKQNNEEASVIPADSIQIIKDKIKSMQNEEKTKEIIIPGTTCGRFPGGWKVCIGAVLDKDFEDKDGFHKGPVALASIFNEDGEPESEQRAHLYEGLKLRLGENMYEVSRVVIGSGDEAAVILKETPPEEKSDKFMRKIEETTVGSVGPWRVAVGNIIDNKHEEDGVKYDGPTAVVTLFRSDKEEGERNITVYPGYSLEIEGKRYVVSEVVYKKGENGYIVIELAEK